MSTCADLGAPFAPACAQIPAKSVMATAVVTPGENPLFHVLVETYEASFALKAVPLTAPFTDVALSVVVAPPHPISIRAIISLHMAPQCSALPADVFRRMAYHHCRRAPGAATHPRPAARHAPAPL